LLVYIALAGANLPDDETRSQGLAMTLGVGGVIAILLLAFFGSVNWAIRRIRGQRKTWWASTFTVWVMLAAFAFSTLSSVGRSIEETKAVDEKAATAVGGTDELARQRADYARWFDAWAASVDPFFDAAVGDAKFTKYASSNQATNSKVISRAKSVRKDFVRWQVSMSALPTPSDYYARPNADLRKAAALFVRAYDLYIEGFRTSAGDKAGDRALDAAYAAHRHAERISRKVRKLLDGKYEELGSSSFGETIGIDAYAENASRRVAELQRITG